MKMRSILPLAVLLAACTGAEREVITATPTPQPTVVALNPVGNYEFSTVVDGQPVKGTFHITADAGGGYGGRVLSNMFPEIPITNVKVEANNMVVVGSMPDGEVTLNVSFAGSNFTGNWAFGAMTGDITGKKLP